MGHSAGTMRDGANCMTALSLTSACIGSFGKGCCVGGKRNCLTSAFSSAEGKRRRELRPVGQRQRLRLDGRQMVASLRGSRRFLAAISRLWRDQCALLSYTHLALLLDDLLFLRCRPRSPLSARQPASHPPRLLSPDELFQNLANLLSVRLDHC